MTDTVLDEWGRLRVAVFLLTCLYFSLYLPSIFHYLFADDETYLAFGNYMVRGLPWSELHLFLLQPANPWEFLPVRDFTYWLDFRIFGGEDFSFHLTNLVWYAVAAIGCNFLLRELILLYRKEWSEKASVLALCGTALFVVHPVHVEAAVWVASRKDLLAGAFSFFSLAFVARGLRHEWRAVEMVAAAFLLLVACFSKASAVTTVMVMTVLAASCWSEREKVPLRRKLIPLVCFWLVAALAFVVHIRMGATTGIRIENDPGVFSMLDRASRVLAGLWGLLVFPYPLGLYHDVYRYGELHWLVGFVTLLGVAIALVVVVRRRSLWAAGVVLITVPCSIYLQFVPFTTWSLVSERFLFVSVAGLTLIFLEVLGRLEKPKHVLALMVAITLPCAVVTWLRVAEWEMPNVVLALEFKRQPGFHNAVRDQILYTLLPARRYSEARELAQAVPRAYARTALVAYIGVERAYIQHKEDKSFAPGVKTTFIAHEYCESVSRLKNELVRGYSQISAEKDVSYNNLLRSLEQNLRIRYSGAEKLCNSRSGV